MIIDAVAKSGEALKSGPIGLAVILVLCVACYFLFKSMSKHMRRVREEFPTELPPDPSLRHQREPVPSDPAAVTFTEDDAQP